MIKSATSQLHAGRDGDAATTRCYAETTLIRSCYYADHTGHTDIGTRIYTNSTILRSTTTMLNLLGLGWATPTKTCVPLFRPDIKDTFYVIKSGSENSYEGFYSSKIQNEFKSEVLIIM